MLRAVALVATALALSTPVAAEEPDDDICARLDTFDRAAFSEPLISHSVVFIWNPRGILGRSMCVHNREPNAKILCDWLLENTSREYTESLPERILGCHGFTFPPMPNVRDWIASYEFWDEKSDRNMLLEINRGGLPGADVVRWTVFPTGKTDLELPLPPLKGIPETKPDQDL